MSEDPPVKLMRTILIGTNQIRDIEIIALNKIPLRSATPRNVRSHERAKFDSVIRKGTDTQVSLGLINNRLFLCFLEKTERDQ